MSQLGDVIYDRPAARRVAPDTNIIESVLPTYMQQTREPIVPFIGQIEEILNGNFQALN